MGATNLKVYLIVSILEARVAKFNEMFEFQAVANKIKQRFIFLM